MSLAGKKYISQAQVSVSGQSHTIDVDELAISFEIIQQEIQLADYSIEKIIKGYRLKFQLSADYWTGDHDYVDTLIEVLSNNAITIRPDLTSSYTCLVILDMEIGQLVRTSRGRRLHGYTLSFKSKNMLQPSELANFKIKNI